MSAQEIRGEIIRENLPKLIKQLTGFEDGDENIRQCEQFAWSIIRNHRYLSTNSHEVKRKIEGIQEKFTVDNCKEYADHLGELCTEIIKHPLCTEHYEVDVHWSLLDFLFSLAHNPTAALKRNKHKIDLDRKQFTVETKQSEESFWKQLLKEDFIPIEAVKYSDSDLSDWSDDSNTDEAAESPSPEHSDSQTVPTDFVEDFSKQLNIKPPKKDIHYVDFESQRSKEYLTENVQSRWWLPAAKAEEVSIPSTSLGANFAEAYSKFLSETSNNLIRFQKPTTISELCVLRELIWMFHSPVNCKLFYIDSSHGVKVRENVSIPSLTVNGLASFVEQHFIPYISMMAELRAFLDSIYHTDVNPPKTLESYAANLRTLLEPVWKELLDYETRLLRQNDFEINTLIHFHSATKKVLSLLESIYQVHSQAILNLKQYPAHITSTYLLSSLMHSNETASSTIKSNLAVSLFLTSIKIFCIIIDTWWTEGRLDDWQHEFIVERSTGRSDQSMCVRKFVKNKEQAFFVPSHVSKMITENVCFRLLLDHSLEAGCTLNLLYEINRIGDLRNACEAIEGKLYNVFIDDVMAHINKLQSQVKVQTEPDVDIHHEDSGICDKSELESTNQLDDVLSNLTTTDDFLLLAFASNINIKQDVEFQDQKDKELNAYDIFQQLQKSEHILMPLEEVIYLSLSRILRTRIAFANNFVMKLYREEFNILKHLGNIRKIFLLEASDLMYQFYDKLFKKIESGQSWANPFLLTIQLDDIICAKFPEMSSLFRIEINSTFRCQTNKVIEAVDELIITYNLGRELSQIISENDTQQYNKVFRFLLKVKWGIMSLENLPFPQSHKRSIPYATFEMIDLLMRRLEQLRFWMIYAIQSIHFHLMTHVLQSMGEQLDAKIANCTNLKEMEMVHKSYISTVYEHCFLDDSMNSIKLGVEQLLNLALILRLEWNSCIEHIESNNNPLAIDPVDNSLEDSDGDYVANSQIDAIELTYIRCHQYLANKLNNEVYLKQKTFLSGLSAAFNTSLPY